MPVDLYTRHFIFSREQMELKKKIEQKTKTKVEFGKVMVNGAQKVFTDIVKDKKDCKFSDAIVLISGDIRTIKYTEPNN